MRQCETRETNKRVQGCSDAVSATRSGVLREQVYVVHDERGMNQGSVG